MASRRVQNMQKCVARTRRRILRYGGDCFGESGKSPSFLNGGFRLDVATTP